MLTEDEVRQKQHEAYTVLVEKGPTSTPDVFRDPNWLYWCGWLHVMRGGQGNELVDKQPAYQMGRADAEGELNAEFDH